MCARWCVRTSFRVSLYNCMCVWVGGCSISDQMKHLHILLFCLGKMRLVLVPVRHALQFLRVYVCVEPSALFVFFTVT